MRLGYENKVVNSRAITLIKKKEMEITGKIIAVLDARSGISARTGNPWKSQEFVIETQEQYPRRCIFRVFGEDRSNAMNIQMGETLTVSFDIDAHEYNGRWFNDISAWKVERNAVTPGSVPPLDIPQSTAMPAENESMSNAVDKVDDLPF